MIKFIPTPIGNPQDITIRALREFESATLFLCEDTRETKRLLRILEERFDFTMPSVDFISFHEHNGKERLKELSSRLKDEMVVYVSDAGMPVISDPGQILVEFAQKNGIAYDVLAGASAVTTAYASSGFESGKFLFWGFLPHKGSSRASELIEVMNSSVDVVLYEAPHRLERLIGEIASIDESREIFLAKELTKKFQKYYRLRAKEMRDNFKNINSKGEWVVIIKAKISKDENRVLHLEDILNFDMPPKIKSKILSKITNKTTKEWYQELILK
jgi:16S rRNA (cytidine1402-2'-O)-methyltransferase